MNRSEEMIAAMSMVEHRMKLQMMAESLGVEDPHEAMPIKVLKGVTTGVCAVGGMVISGVTAYTVGMLVSSAIPWAEIESEMVKTVVKGGTIGLGTLAGTAAGKVIYDVGDDINSIIDIMCDKALSKDISAVLADRDDVKEVVEFNKTEDAEETEEEE